MHVQHGADALQDLLLQPAQAGVLVHAFEGSTYGVYAHDVAQAKLLGLELVTAHGVDVGVTPVPAENAQPQGAHHVVPAASTVASVVERTLAHELRPSRPLVEELKEKDQLPFARHWCLHVPLGVKSSSRGVE